MVGDPSQKILPLPAQSSDPDIPSQPRPLWGAEKSGLPHGQRRAEQQGSAGGEEMGSLRLQPPPQLTLPVRVWGLQVGLAWSVSHSRPQPEHLRLSEGLLPPLLSWLPRGGRAVLIVRAGSAPPQGGLARCRKPVDSTPQGLLCPKDSCSGPHLCSWGAQEARAEQARGPPPHRVSPLPEGSSSVQARKVTNSGSLHPLSPVGSHLPNPACHKVGGCGALGHSTSLCCQEGKSPREAWDPGNLGSWKFKRVPVG